jgi:Trk K+ transport system NAD-binding subunit
LLPKEVTFVSGDGRDEETLKRAGIDDATSVISATHNDAINLSTCLVAKGLNSNIRAVVRLFDGGFARKVEQALDVDSALSASRISAPGFVGAAVYAESAFSFATEDEFVTIIPKDGSFEFVRTKLKPLPAQS